ncbi:hypothetical protein SAMN02799638_01909 [Arthrobacter sp. UNCCL28]|nr:hypothetical protein SAMN02799638_01909 [Arthrobacter sp. UNCCL28]
MEGGQDDDGSGQFVAGRGTGSAARDGLDPRGEYRTAECEPVRVGIPGAARDEVRQPVMNPRRSRRGAVHDLRLPCRCRADLCGATHAQSAQRVRRPGHSAGSESRSRTCQCTVLGEGRSRAVPDTLGSQQHDSHAETGDVMKPNPPSAKPHGKDVAVRTASDLLADLDAQDEALPVAVTELAYASTPSSASVRATPASGTRHRVILVADGWSIPIQRGPGLIPPAPRGCTSGCNHGVRLRAP